MSTPAPVPNASAPAAAPAVKTPEQIAAEQKTAEEKVAKEKAAAEAAAKKKADKEAAKAKATAEREAKKKEKADAKAAAKKAKEDSKMPEQNSVRRPKPETICGKAWAIFDELSAKSGAPATIADSLKNAGTIAEATVRTQYARWRKYHGISGRVEAPAAPAVTETAPAAAPPAA